jgi:hypothetical protein
MIIEFDKSFSKSLDKLKDSLVKKRIERIILDFDRTDIIIDINYALLHSIIQADRANPASNVRTRTY